MHARSCTAMRYRAILGLATAFLLGASGAVGARSIAEISGTWESADADGAVIALQTCPEGLCGQVLRQPASGAELAVIGNFTEVSPTQWEGGRIYNMNDGATYVVDLELLDPANLRVRACWLAFCEVQRWQRVP